MLLEFGLIIFHSEYELDDDVARTDFETVHSWLTTVYWSMGISRERVERGAANSALVIGAFDNQTGAQAGYMRVVSDTTRFAYISDVFVHEDHRGKGLAREMVRMATNHPDLTEVTRWILATRDAHEVYKSVGFDALEHPSRWMQYVPAPATAVEKAP